MGGDLRGCGLLARPSRGFVPAADLLFAPPKSRQKALPCKTALRVPCDARSPGPRPTHFATLRSNKGARSQSLNLASLGPRASALLGGFEGEAPNSPPQQPTAKPESRSQRGISIPPSEPAEKRRALSPRAQLASRTDSRRLFEQSVAERVRRAGSRTEHRRAARCEAKGRAVRGRFLWLLSWAPKKVTRPRGRKPKVSLNPRMGLATSNMRPEASPCL
jgi:hypothetical protein